MRGWGNKYQILDTGFSILYNKSTIFNRLCRCTKSLISYTIPSILLSCLFFFISNETYLIKQQFSCLFEIAAGKHMDIAVGAVTEDKVITDPIRLIQRQFAYQVPLPPCASFPTGVCEKLTFLWDWPVICVQIFIPNISKTAQLVFLSYSRISSNCAASILFLYNL